MKKYLVLPALLAVISLTVLTAGHIWVNSARDKIEMGEQILLGDPAAAGLTAVLHAGDTGWHLSWDTVFTPGQAEQEETDFRFSAAGKEEATHSLPYAVLSSAQPSYQFRKVDSVPDSLRLPVEDVAARTAAGEERTESVRLADYYEYYPLSFEVSLDGEWGASLQSKDGMEMLERYFRLEMDERETVEITVSKNRDGTVSSWEVRRSQFWSNLYSSGLPAKRGIYLTADSVDQEGRPDGRLQCRDGRGVHFIPAREDKKYGSAEEWFDMTRIHLFYPVENAEILYLRLSADENRLLLYTSEDGQLVLTVLDAENGDVLQRLEVMELDGELAPNLIEQDSLQLLVLGSGRFCLIEEKKGTYTCVFSGFVDSRTEYAEQFTAELDRASWLAWDGEQLAFAVARKSIVPFDPPYIGVVGKEGLRCLARYDYSLGRDPCQQHDDPEYRGGTPVLTVAFSTQ